MISNIIQLGKNVDAVPFAESVDENQEIIEMKLGLDSSNQLFLERAEVANAANKKLFHISPTKAINRGKNQHFYPHDFTLSNSFIKDSDGDKNIPGIINKKVHRNFKNTQNFYENLDLTENLESFIKTFYQFVLKDESKFIGDTFEQTEDYFEDINKTDFGNVIFAFSLSEEIVDRFDFNKAREGNYYNLGELESFKSLITEIIASDTLDNAPEGASCSFCKSRQRVFAPSSATFYFSFANNPENVFYQLSKDDPDRHLLICRDCYASYNAGKKFMENNLKSNLLGSKYFSVFEINQASEEIRGSLNYILEGKDVSNVYTQESLKRLRQNLEEDEGVLLDLGAIGEKEGLGITMFFYEYDNGYRVIKTIHDIYPRRNLDLLRENDRLNYFSFNAFLNGFFRDQSNNAYDLLVKRKLDLLEKLLLEIPINYDSLRDRFLDKASYQLRNDQGAGQFTERFFRFLELLNRLDSELYSHDISLEYLNQKGASLNMNSAEDLTGESGLEKMNQFLEENEFLKSTPEIRAAIPMGVVIARLSQFEISNYDKRMLGFAQRRITDKDSLKKYFNEIEEKVVMHDMGNQKMVADFSEKMPVVLSKDDFSPDDFILGLFTGYSLAANFTNE